MVTNYEKNNVAHVVGTVVEKPSFSHLILGEGFYDLKVKVPRLSEEFDTLPVTISERLIDSINVGDTLSVDGQFRSYNKLEDGRSKLILTVFAKDVYGNSEEKNCNKVELVGYICKEPIYRTTPFGREICDLLIAVNRAYNKSDYLPCIAWGRNARFVKSLEVGEKIKICGRIQSRNYMKKISDDVTEERTAYEISINTIALDDDENEN